MFPAFRQDGSVNVVVETPRGSQAKFKYDPETGAIMLSRPLPAGVVYPYDWGYIPSTRAADGDPIDVMVLWDGTSFPGVVLPSRLVGVLRVEQTGAEPGRRERNDRLFALPIKAPRSAHVQTIFDLPERVRLEIRTVLPDGGGLRGEGSAAARLRGERRGGPRLARGRRGLKRDR
jgi:inorganic pyrophosphatase